MSYLTSRSSVLTLSFVPGSSNEFVNALKSQAKFVDDDFGVKYHIEGGQVETIGEMKSGKWVAYAARALVMRFWDLTKVSSISINAKCVTDQISPEHRKQTHLISCLSWQGIF